MSIYKEDTLHLLIHSLGKAEKRHFKVYSRKHVIGKENTYVTLFNAIEKQTEYDEKALKQNPKFSDFAPLKNRLSGAILKSLEIFHSSPGINTRRLLNQIEILFSRSHFVLCSRLIRKVKKQVQAYEMLEEWLEILQFEFRLAVKRTDMPSRIKTLEEESKVIRLLNNQKQYRDLANHFSFLYQKLGSKNIQQVSSEMKELLQSASLKDEKLAQTLMAKQFYYDCFFQFFLLREDYKNAFAIARKKTDLFLKNPLFIDLNPSYFLNTVNGFLVACTGMGDHLNMLDYLGKLKEMSPHLKSSADKAQAYFYSYHLLNYYINTGKFSEAELVLKRIEAELPLHLKGLNRLQKVVLYTTIAHIYFGVQKYKNASLWLNRSMLLGEEKVRTDIECFVRLFFLIVQVEMKSDPAYLRSLFSGTFRFLKKNKRLFEFEAALMKFIKQNLSQWNHRLLYSIKHELSRIEKRTTERHAQNYFDFSAWIESKIENKPYATVVRRKNKAD